MSTESLSPLLCHDKKILTSQSGLKINSEGYPYCLLCLCVWVHSRNCAVSLFFISLGQFGEKPFFKPVLIYCHSKWHVFEGSRKKTCQPLYSKQVVLTIGPYDIYRNVQWWAPDLMCTRTDNWRDAMQPTLANDATISYRWVSARKT